MEKAFINEGDDGVFYNEGTGFDKNEFKNQVKKELYKTKEIARFAYYAAGNLNYNIAVLGGSYQFPIPVTERFNGDIRLSSDLGTTPFNNEMKGSDLNRWISKAIDSGEFVKIN